MHGRGERASSVAFFILFLGCGCAGQAPRGDASTVDAASAEHGDASPEEVGDVPEQAPLPATAAEFCALADEISIAATVRCEGGTDAAWRGAAVFSCDVLDSAGAEGTFDFDVTKAAACLAELRASAETCGGYSDCERDVVKGLVPDNGSCVHPYQCGPGASCWSRDLSCGSFTCWAAAGDGDDCSLVGCALGLVCDPPSKKCRRAPLGDVGDPCDSGCREGLTCVYQSSTNSSVCRSIVPGGPCASSEDCPWYQYCDSTCRPRLSVGAACEPALHGCVRFAWCDPSTSRCEATGEVGEPCSALSCLEGWCDFGTNVCRPAKRSRAECLSDDECQSRVCSYGFCSFCPR
jgi:hypothetical protein